MYRRIFHWGGWGRNIGDFAIRYAMEHGITGACQGRGKLIQFVPMDCKRHGPLNMPLVDMINEHGDMLLVGAGGQLMGGDGYVSKSGWQFDIPLELVASLDVPLVFYGLGWNYFPGQQPLPDTEDHIRACFEKAAYVSFRDTASANHATPYVPQGGVNTVCDPALFLPAGTAARLPHGRYKIGLNWAGDRTHQRFRNTAHARNYARVVAEGLRLFADQVDGHVYYLPHATKYDTDESGVNWPGFFEQYIGDRFSAASALFPWAYPERYEYTPFYVSLWDAMDIAVGMRGHACIIPYGRGKPVVGLAGHDKVRFFADDAEFAVIANEDDMMPEDVARTVAQAAVDRAAHAAQAKRLARFRELHENGMFKIMAMLL